MGIFGPAPSIIDAGAAAVEGMRRLQDYVEGDDYDSLTDEELQQWADDNGFSYRKEDGVTHLEPETEEAQQLVAETDIDSDEEYPIERRMLESGPEILALESENNAESGSTMTDDYEFELNQTEALHAGSMEHYENQDEYGDLEQGELEALGLALYVEEAVSDESDLVDRDDMINYIMENDVDGEAFVEFKKGLASDYDDFAETMNAFIGHRDELIEELGATGTLYQALQAETRAERDSAEDAMSSVKSAASDAKTSSEWLDNVADLDGAIQAEQESAQRKQELEEGLQEIREEIGLEEDDE
ncbi:hypothetical protein ACK3SF_00445 [Candidatus Nanosalina sp. VS9-1]|uniref:hypothetical protein n=1 Tax=Candidatus Nanosalina sp. VS9-1 TaxID=3388566 RepID=UPI0039E1D731